MPIVRTREKCLQAGNRPEWSGATSAGIFTIPARAGKFDCHYHECNEYWLVFKGKVKVMSEGKEYFVQRGDIVCTKAGDEHDIVEIYEDLEAFWFEDVTPPGGKVGHRHRDPEKAKGHPVPCLPLPAEFPR